MLTKEMDFLISALTQHNLHMKTEDSMDWLLERQHAHRFHIEKIPFKKMGQWFFESATGNLVHKSGKFFAIEGVWVETNFGSVPVWSQPIINQPEVGILGILARKFDGILHFLMQAKMEPGNINMVQLAPTVQATRSNYTQAHQGSVPPYLDYFTDRSSSKVLVDSLQSEQGARFLRKRNRNIIIETNKNVPVLNDYCWLTLGQIHKLLSTDNIVNMDTRTVLAGIPFAVPGLECVNASDVSQIIKNQYNIDTSLIQTEFDNFKADIFNGMLDTQQGIHDYDTIISWFTERKIHYELDVERIPLKFVKDWYQTDFAIRHESDNFFSVIAVSVEAENREVTNWTQPLVKPVDEGIIAFLVKKIDGILHFLVQAKIEPGNFDIVEMAPTVQCVTGSYKQVEPEDRPLYVDYVLNASPRQVRFSAMQSEEGGRFFQEQNRNIIVEVEDDFPIPVPDDFLWMTLNQIKQFIKYNNYINVEGRSLLSCLGLLF